jgi:hypothetical protein
MGDSDPNRKLCSMHVELAEKTREAIRQMLATADKMDQVWRRCKGTKAGATALSIVGGGLTIGAGIATILTAGVAFPLFISGLVISIVGGASNVITTFVKEIRSSNELKALETALKDFKEKERLFKDIFDKISPKQEILGTEIVRLGLTSGKEFAGWAGLKCIYGLLKTVNPVTVRSAIGTAKTLKAFSSLGGTAGQSAAMVTAKQASKAIGREIGEEIGRNVGPTVGKEIGKEVGEVIGKEAGRAAARSAGIWLIVPSAIFVIWEAVDLGVNISDLVKEKGSEAGNVLREEARRKEEELEKFCCCGGG